MDEFNFDELRNFSVPESWVKSALEIPSQKPAKQVSGVSFYRYAAAVAACVVIAAAVTFSLIFGINNDIELTSPNPAPDASSKTDAVSGTSAYTPASGTQTQPQTQSVLLYRDSPESTEKNEPSESKADNNTNNSKPIQKPQTDPQDVTEALTQFQTDPDGTSSQPSTADSEKTEPATQTCADTTTQITTHSPVMSGCRFETTVSAELAEGNIYFRMEDENGVILGGKGLFDDYRLADKSPKDSSRVKLSYTLSQTEAEKADGKIYSVFFYNSGGTVIKTITVPVFKNLYVIFK